MVIPDHLEPFLRRLDPDQVHFIGAPGFGKHAEDFVEEGFIFCMGGPGILLSRGALRKIKDKIHTCFDKLLTEHEDLELGRCIWRITKKSRSLNKII